MADEATTRRCIGSERFGIEAHEAPVEDFPNQPSQKDGLGRMCKVHWNEYTLGLARDAKARKAAEATPAEASITETASAQAGSCRGRTANPPKSPKPEPIRTRSPRPKRAQTPAGGSQGDAG